MRSTANIYTLSDAVSRSQKGLLFGSPGKLFPSRSRRHEHGHHQHAGDEPKAHEHHRNLPHARARVRGRQIAKVQRGWLTEAGAGVRGGVVLGPEGGTLDAGVLVGVLVDDGVDGLKVQSAGAEALLVHGIRPTLELEVSALAPVLAEGVFENPVLDGLALDNLLAPTDDDDGVVDGHNLRVRGVRRGSAVGRSDDTRGVQLEYLVGVDADGDGLLRDSLHERRLAGVKVELAVAVDPVLEVHVRRAVAVRGTQAGLDAIQHALLLLGAQGLLEEHAKLAQVTGVLRLIEQSLGVLLANGGDILERPERRAGSRAEHRGALRAREETRGAVERPRGGQTTVLVDPLVRGEHVPGVAAAVVVVAVDELLGAELHVFAAASADHLDRLDGVRGGVRPAGRARRLLRVDLTHHLRDIRPVEVARVLGAEPSLRGGAQRHLARHLAHHAAARHLAHAHAVRGRGGVSERLGAPVRDEIAHGFGGSVGELLGHELLG